MSRVDLSLFRRLLPHHPSALQKALRQRGLGKHGDDAVKNEQQGDVLVQDLHKPRLPPKTYTKVSVRVHDDS